MNLVYSLVASCLLAPISCLLPPSPYLLPPAHLLLPELADHSEAALDVRHLGLQLPPPGEWKTETRLPNSSRAVSSLVLYWTVTCAAPHGQAVLHELVLLVHLVKALDLGLGILLALHVALDILDELRTNVWRTGEHK